MGIWLFYTRQYRRSRAGKMDGTTIAAIIALSMLGAGVGAMVRTILALYVPPWNGVPPCPVGGASAARRQLFGRGDVAAAAPAPLPSPPLPARGADDILHSLSLVGGAGDYFRYSRESAISRRGAAAARDGAAVAPASRVGDAEPDAAPRALQPAASDSAACVGLFPASTFISNISGSLILGVVSRLSSQLQWSPLVLAAVGTGFCGGLTTMSTFINEVVVLASQNEGATAALYWFSTQAACLFFGWAGWAVVDAAFKK